MTTTDKEIHDSRFKAFGLRITRKPELYYGKVPGNRGWSYYESERCNRVGEIYQTKAELLADLDQYHRDAWQGSDR